MSSERDLNLKIIKDKIYRLNFIRYWNHFIDIISIIWVFTFIISLLASDIGIIVIDSNIIILMDSITLFILPFFVMDLMMKYYSLGHSKTFLKNHWLSILLVIPYFRVFKIAKLSQITQVSKPLVNMVKVIHKTMKLIRK